MADKHISPSGLDLIRNAEGTVYHAYKDSVGVWTIGTGHTGPDVREGMMIDKAQAEALLRSDLDRFEKGVSRLAPVTTQGQFEALVSFAFNLGLAALAGSTLLKLHNAGDYAAAAGEFAKWDKAGGHVLQGLAKRRAAESARYGERG